MNSLKVGASKSVNRFNPHPPSSTIVFTSDRSKTAVLVLLAHMSAQGELF